MSTQILTRTLHPEVRVTDRAKGIVEYIASDESIDSYREVIRADGWRFDRFQKNAPFLDSHQRYELRNVVGKVIDWRVEGRKLIETVQWAIDVPENTIAQLGWKMTEAGYLRAVSVGFMPVREISKFGNNPADYAAQLKELGLEGKEVRTIYLEQQQVELSACVIGANENALARSYKANVLTDADLDLISQKRTERENADATDDPADVAEAGQRARAAFLVKLHSAVARL